MWWKQKLIMEESETCCIVNVFLTLLFLKFLRSFFISENCGNNTLINFINCWSNLEIYIKLFLFSFERLAKYTNTKKELVLIYKKNGMISVTDLNQQQYSENLYKTSGHWYELITEYKRIEDYNFDD